MTDSSVRVSILRLPSSPRMHLPSASKKQAALPSRRVKLFSLASRDALPRDPASHVSSNSEVETTDFADFQIREGGHSVSAIDFSVPDRILAAVTAKLLRLSHPENLRFISYLPCLDLPTRRSAFRYQKSLETVT